MKLLMSRALSDASKAISRIRQKYYDDFVFIHINKTGGSSIERALSLPYQHRTALEKIEEIGRKQWDGKFTFTVVRNPWDKVVSQYHYRVQINQTNLAIRTVPFVDWVKLTYGSQDPFYYQNPKMFMPQTDWITDLDGSVLVKRICRFENFSGDFAEVCNQLRRPCELPHVRKSERGDYRMYYDDETTDIIGKWFSKDIESFGYKF
jgi:hypothetical protein